MKNNTNIENIDEINLFYGIKTGLNKAFLIDEEVKNQLISEDIKNKEIIQPVLRGKDIDRYKINYKNLYLIFTRRGIDIAKYPIVKNYLSHFKEELTPRKKEDDSNKKGRKPGKYQWYEIQDTVKYHNELKKPKLIWQRVCQKPNFVIDREEGYYIIDSMVFLTSNEKKYQLEYLLMILNSNVIEWYLKRIGHKLGKTGFLLSNQYVNRLPIPHISLESQNKYKNIIKKLIELKKEEDEEKTDIIKDYENSLNNEVYALFNLSSEEINLIEKDLQ